MLIRRPVSIFHFGILDRLGLIPVTSMFDGIRLDINYFMNEPGLMDISDDGCRFQAIKDHLFSDLNGQAVILSMKNGRYYGLNAVGLSVWNAVQNPATLAQIEAAIVLEYDVDSETCRQEVGSFLESMLSEELIEAIVEQGK